MTTGNASYPRTLLAISSPGESFAVGDPVFPRSSQAELRIGKTLIAKAIELSYPVFVRKMTGDWIYVRIEAKKTDAWIQRKDVCTTSEAPAFFTSRIAAEPTDRHAWWMRSLAREAAGDLAAALEDAEHLLKERQSVKAFHLRGSLLMAKGEYVAAEADFRAALRTDPRNAEVWCTLARLERERGNLHEATNHVQEAIRHDPRLAPAHNVRGSILHAKQDWPAAAAAFDEAIRLDPLYPPPYNNRGAVREMQGVAEKAAADYSKALQLDVRYRQAMLNLAWLRATSPDAKSRNGLAALVLARNASQPPFDSDPLTLDTLAAAYAESGEFAKAVETQVAALLTAPEPWKDVFRRRLELYRQGKAYHRN